MALEILLVIKGIHVRLKRNRESVYKEWFSQVRDENLGNIKQRLMITLCTEKAVGLGWLTLAEGRRDLAVLQSLPTGQQADHRGAELSNVLRMYRAFRWGYVWCRGDKLASKSWSGLIFLWLFLNIANVCVSSRWSVINCMFSVVYIHLSIIGFGTRFSNL